MCLIYFGISMQIGRSYVISKLKDYPQFRAVAIAIQRSGFKVCIICILSAKPKLCSWPLYILGPIVPIFLFYLIWKRTSPATLSWFMVSKLMKSLKVLSFWVYVLKKAGSGLLMLWNDLWEQKNFACVGGKVFAFKSFEKIIIDWDHYKQTTCFNRKYLHC